ncbi:MAG TPA: hypothetical protein VNO30_13845 [Kofleriaceae bacterium]|nr:hypothetical protein [Kofleriaceae bacterium]
MANNVTYVMMHVRDDHGREQNHLLGELHDVYERPFSVGSDPGCDVILDHPSVPPRAAEFSAGSNHRMVRVTGAEQRERIDGRPVRIGALQVQLVEVIDPRRAALPPSGIAVRFGPRGLGAIQAADVPEDPRATEAGRLADALRDPRDHVRQLDDASAAWCEARLRDHFAALAQVTAPPCSLSLTRVEYTSSLDDAIARWNREWGAAEARPFRYVTWSHVHRVSKWMSELDHARARDLSYAERYARRVGAQLREALQYTTSSLVAAHLATLEDDVSPARPLASLLARGVYALALPDSAVLLYLASGLASGLASVAAPTQRSSDPIERDFVDALAAGDPAGDRAGLVYGDYLEERGELVRAEAVRAQGGPTIGVPVHYAFEDARPLLLFNPRDVPTPRALVPDTSVPGARLEIDGRVHPLGSRTGIAWLNDQLVVDPPPGTSVAMLTQSGGALWLNIARDYASAALNHRTLFDRTRQPLFDGDLITLRERSAIVRL